MGRISSANRNDYFAVKCKRESGKGFLTSFGEQKNTEMGNKSQIFATREDLRQEAGRLDLKLSETKADLIKEIDNLNVDLNMQMANLSVDLNKQIANLSVDINKQITNLVKWVVGFGITIVLTLFSHFLDK
jgi:hypothetical protein